MLNNRYKKVSKIGRGAYSTVYKATDEVPEGKMRLLDQNILDTFSKVDSHLTKSYITSEMEISDMEEVREEVRLLKQRDWIFN
jgi:serine/threonine protein kinase